MNMEDFSNQLINKRHVRVNHELLQVKRKGKELQWVKTSSHFHEKSNSKACWNEEHRLVNLFCQLFTWIEIFKKYIDIYSEGVIFLLLNAGIRPLKKSFGVVIFSKVVHFWQVKLWKSFFLYILLIEDLKSS